MVGKVLVAGASGVVGTSAVAAFANAGWEVVSLSRRKPDLRPSGSVAHISVDLTYKNAVYNELCSLNGITHVVFAAVSEAPGLISGWFDKDRMRVNLEMLQNGFVRPTWQAGLRDDTGRG